MSPAPSNFPPANDALLPAERYGYIVLDLVEPGKSAPLDQVAASHYARCQALDRPYAAAILGPGAAVVVLDLTPCSWQLCAACLDKARAVIINYPDGPTKAPDVVPGLIRVVEVSRLVAPFLAWELVGDAIDCRKRHGPATTDKWAPRMFEVSRTTSPGHRAEVVTPAP